MFAFCICKKYAQKKKRWGDMIQQDIAIVLHTAVCQLA